MINRRQFLGSATMAVLSAQFLAACASRSVLPTGKEDQAIVFILDGNGTIVRRLGLRSGEHSDVRIPLTYPHTAHRVLGSPDELIIIGFLNSAFKVNLVTKAVHEVRPQGHLFMGHGVQTSVPGAIWCSEVLDSGESLIRKRLTADLSLAPGPGTSFPGVHHLVRLPGTETIVSGTSDLNSGKAFIRFYDTATGTQKVYNFPGKLGLGHMMALSETEVLCVVKRVKEKEKIDSTKIEVAWLNQQLRPMEKRSHSWEKYRMDFVDSVPLVYANTSGEIRFFWDEPRMDLFRFSFGFDFIPGNPVRFISGHTESNVVILWNRDLSVQEVISVPQPYALLSSSDGSGFYVLSNGALKFYSLLKKTFISEIKYDSMITGVTRFV